MPEAYRQTLIRQIAQHAHSEIIGIFVLSILNAIERWCRPDGRVDQAALGSEIYWFATPGHFPRNGSGRSPRVTPGHARYSRGFALLEPDPVKGRGHTRVD